MQRIAGRDTAAWSVLYDRYSALVFPLCLRILGDRTDAEELLADIFWTVWTEPARYDPARGSLLSYLLILTRSRGIDRLRSQRRHQTVAREAQQAGTASSQGGGQGDSPLAEALLAEQRSWIRQALGELQPEQRRAIELCFYEGLSHSEIAAKLGQPLGTVKGRIRNGLIHLRNAVRSFYTESAS